jgi:hypothetical protein
MRRVRYERAPNPGAVLARPNSSDRIIRAILIDRGIGLLRHSLLREPAEGVEAGVARRPAALPPRATARVNRSPP